MKEYFRNIDGKSGGGAVKLEAEENDDMYHMYNLINKEDEVEATTQRNVVTESKSGARDKTRVLTVIRIKVENIEFDAEQCALRLKGKNIKENEYIKLGQYHTLEIELHRPCIIEKEKWDTMHLETLADCIDMTRTADVAALVMQEGLANLCLIKAALTKHCIKIERIMPHKKQNTKSNSGGVQRINYDEAMGKFFSDCYQAIKRFINFEIIKAVVIGSPGFLNEDFIKYLLDRAMKEEDHELLRHKAKFMKAHTSSGYKRAIEEMLSSPDTIAQLGTVKAAEEVKALNTFYEVLSADPDRACYGYKEVHAANEQLAIDTLLISDAFYRAENYDQRNEYINLIESVKANGGRIFKFSSMHVTGEQLNMYTGIAATLRFPLPDIADDLEEDDEDDDEEELIAKHEKAELAEYNDLL